MQELLELVIQIIRGAWRFRWWALAVAMGCFVVGWLVVGTQKDVYEARARVYVDTQSQLRQLLDDQIVEINVEEQLRYVREALLGRPQLRRLAQETGLDRGIDTLEAEQALIDRLSRSIGISSASEGDRQRRNVTRTDDTYTINYYHHDRQVAIDVVQTMLDIFVEDTIGGRRRSSEAAGDFLTRQLTEYEEQLREAESRLADFKRRNVERMPGMQGDYFDRLETASEELDAARQELRLAESRLESTEQQIRGESPRVTSSGAPEPNSLEARILDNESRLDDLRLRFTDSHPDVIAARENVEQLRRRQQEQYAEMAAQGGASSATNNPVLQALRISRNEIASEVATLKADVAQREQRVERLRSLINEMPEVEAELARLNRDYDVVRARYQALVDSLQRERLTREVVESEQLEFRIIDPPVASSTPVSPPRALLMLAVLFGSLGAGVIAAYFLDQLKPVFHSTSSLESFIGGPVAASVGRVWSHDSWRAGRRAVAGFATATFVFIVVNVIVLVFEVNGPGIRGFL